LNENENETRSTNDDQDERHNAHLNGRCSVGVMTKPFVASFEDDMVMTSGLPIGVVTKERRRPFSPLINLRRRARETKSGERKRIEKIKGLLMFKVLLFEGERRRETVGEA
tara:strand:+ start:310 stop:642 length:333 start_codon:yes stop_codon:yes gene_type:complete